MENRQVHAVIVSDSPGRLRVRLHRDDRKGDILERTQAHLQGQPGVHHVDTNRATGSVTVRYDPRTHSSDDVIAMLRDACVVAERTAAALGEEVPQVGASSTSLAIQAALDDLDRRLSRLTGRRVDLKLLFPFGLAAIGVRQLFTRGLGLNQVPAYMMLWYAFDSFWKFHSAQPGPVGSTVHRRDEGQPAQPSASSD